MVTGASVRTTGSPSGASSTLAAGVSASRVSTVTGRTKGLARSPASSAVTNSSDGFQSLGLAKATARARLGCSPWMTASAPRRCAARKAGGSLPWRKPSRPGSVATTFIASDALSAGAPRTAGRVAVNRPLNGSSALPSRTSRVLTAAWSASRDGVSRSPGIAVLGSRCALKKLWRVSVPWSSSLRSVPASPAALSDGRSSGTNEPASTWSRCPGAPQCVHAGRELRVVIPLCEREPRVERLRAGREREGHVDVGSDRGCLTAEPSAGRELADDGRVERAVERERGVGYQRPNPRDVELLRGRRREIDDGDVGHEARERGVVGVAELHLDRVDAVALTADAEFVHVDLHHAHAARVDRVLVERASRQGEHLRKRRIVAEARVERAPRQHAIVHGEGELQAVGVARGLQAHREGAAARSPCVLRCERECRCGARLRMRGNHPREARKHECGSEHCERESRSHSERPNTASPAGRRRKPNDS